MQATKKKSEAKPISKLTHLEYTNRAEKEPFPEDSSLTEEHEKYLKEPQRIGFMESMPTIEVLKTELVMCKCRNWSFAVEVRLVLVSFASKEEDKMKHTCHALETSNVDIARFLPLNGFGSYCFHDEAQTMEKALVEVAKKWDLTTYRKVNSWPTAKAVVGPNHRRVYEDSKALEAERLSKMSEEEKKEEQLRNCWGGKKHDYYRKKQETIS